MIASVTKTLKTHVSKQSGNDDHKINSCKSLIGGGGGGVGLSYVLLSVRVEFADCVIAYNFLNTRRIWKIQSS